MNVLVRVHVLQLEQNKVHVRVQVFQLEQNNVHVRVQVFPLEQNNVHVRVQVFPLEQNNVHVRVMVFQLKIRSTPVMKIPAELAGVARENRGATGRGLRHCPVKCWYCNGNDGYTAMPNYRLHKPFVPRECERLT